MFCRRPCSSSSKNLAHAKPSKCWRPSLNFEREQEYKDEEEQAALLGRSGNTSPVMMELPCTVALLGLGDKEWANSGMWMLTAKEEEEVLAKMGGAIDQKEFESFCNAEANAEWLRKLPSSAKGLQSKSLLPLAFEHFDWNNDKELNSEEWHGFLFYIAQLRLRYLQVLAFQGYRAYWGRVQRKPFHDGNGFVTNDTTQYHIDKYLQEMQEHTDSQRKGQCCVCCFGGTFQVGLLVDDWRGWLADLWYYSSNFHPLHGIFSCDANNKLENGDRFFMELSTAAFCLWMVHERKHQADTQNFFEYLENDQMWSIVAVTLPGYVIWYTLFFLFTTPCSCATADESIEEQKTVERARRIAHIGDFIGIALVISMIVVFAIRVTFYMSTDPWNKELVLKVLTGRLLSYGLSWFLMLAIYFNPFVCWGSTDPVKSNCVTRLADLIALGQWTAEKQRLQFTCLHISEKAKTTSGDALKEGRSCESYDRITSCCGLSGRDGKDNKKISPLVTF